MQLNASFPSAPNALHSFDPLSRPGASSSNDVSNFASWDSPNFLSRGGRYCPWPICDSVTSGCVVGNVVEKSRCGDSVCATAASEKENTRIAAMAHRVVIFDK